MSLLSVVEVLFLVISLIKASYKQFLIRMGGHVELDEEDIQRKHDEKVKRRKENMLEEVQKLYVSYQ